MEEFSDELIWFTNGKDFDFSMVEDYDAYMTQKYNQKHKDKIHSYCAKFKWRRATDDEVCKMLKIDNK